MTSFNNELFRNAYRIRDEDVFDLSFATKSKFYQETLQKLNDYKTAHPEISEDEPIFEYLKNKVPGEEVIVRRMIWEIVHKSKYHQYITDDHILVFEDNPMKRSTEINLTLIYSISFLPSLMEIKIIHWC